MNFLPFADPTEIENFGEQTCLARALLRA